MAEGKTYLNIGRKMISTQPRAGDLDGAMMEGRARGRRRA